MFRRQGLGDESRFGSLIGGPHFMRESLVNEFTSTLVEQKCGSLQFG